MEQRTITANGLEFAYLRRGPEDGPLALCLHGFPDTAHTWRYLLPELAAAGFRAVAPFLRGYAPTQIPADGRYQIGALVQDANALHEALGGGRGRRAHRPRLGGAGHLRRGGPRARRAGAARSPRPSLPRRPSACRCSPTPSSSGAGTCSSSSRRWPRWRCRSTTTPSSTTSGGTGHPATTGRGTWPG